MLVVAGCGGASQETIGGGAATTNTATRGAEQTLDIEGHRGARGLRPENTLPSFEVALDHMVTTLELDMHLSADDAVVVWHDPTITPDKCALRAGAPAGLPDPGSSPQADLRVRALTVEQLGWLQCDRNPDPGSFPDQTSDRTAIAGDDYSIVTLDEVFAFVAEYATSPLKTEEQRANAATVRFNIETKRKPNEPSAIDDGFDGIHAGAFERAVLEAVDGANVEDRTMIQSFDHRSLVAIHAVAPDIALAALTSRTEPDFATYAGFGAIVWSPNRRDVTGTRVEEAHAAGLAVVPWTVNEPNEMRQLIGLGVDGLITDRPDLAAAVAEEAGRR